LVIEKEAPKGAGAEKAQKLGKLFGKVKGAYGITSAQLRVLCCCSKCKAASEVVPGMNTAIAAA
jgi:hypothetical protein